MRKLFKVTGVLEVNAISENISTYRSTTVKDLELSWLSKVMYTTIQQIFSQLVVLNAITGINMFVMPS